MACSRLLKFSLCLFFVLVFQESQAATPRGKELREFTGAHTRVVWIQDAGETACVFSEKPTIKLMAFDSDDDKGERAILPQITQYWKPVISADGERVFFGNKAENTVCVVNWDGTGLKTLVKNARFEDAWSDPKDGTEWVYACVTEKREDKDVPVIRRYRVDKPEVSELVWDKTPVFMFMLSKDGRVASGGGDGGNSPQGMLTLPNGEFYQRAGGCWPSMSPDNSYRMWVFTGNHRSIHMCIPTNKSGSAYSYNVNFDVPGLKRSEEAYHPRWSNKVRFFQLTSPFSEWNYKSDAKIPNAVAEKVEIYIGKFAEDFKSVEKWIRVTENSRGDYWPNVWIKPSKDELAAAAPPDLPEGKPVEKLDSNGLIYVWNTGSESNQINDPLTKAIRQCSGQFRDAARYDRYYVMDLTDGAFVPEGADSIMLSSSKASNQISLEAIMTPLAKTGKEDSFIISYADELASGNFILAQQGEYLTLRLRTDDSDNLTSPIRLCRLTVGKPHHVIVSYTSGSLTCYVNGRRVLLPVSPTGKLSKWTPQHLIFGDAWKGGYNWSGLLEGIGIFNRQISATEAKQRYIYQRDKRAERKPVERVVIEAKLTGRCAAADPKGIAPYRRCFSSQQFEVQKVLEGKLDKKIITVAQWSVLDAKVVPEYTKMAVGQTYKLALEKWSDHPEQESERMISGDFEESDLFYEVRLDKGSAASSSASAPPQVAEWKGLGGNPNKGGAWEGAGSDIPWSTGKTPAQVDSVVLGNVTEGKREITTTKPVIIRQLTIKQEGKGTNRLQLGEEMTILGNDTPLILSASPSIELDANGHDLTFENDTLKEVSFKGNVRLGGNGSVVTATVLDGGFGYTMSPTVKMTGGGGEGAVGEAFMSVKSIELIRLGTGYTSEPTITISEPDIASGRQATAKARFDKASGALTRIYVEDSGSGYTRIPRIEITGGGGAGAEAEATLFVSEIFITKGGKGYKTPPTVTLEGGNGEKAIAQATMQLTTLRYTAGQGHAVLTNEGILEQDAAAIRLDWAAPSNGGGNRLVTNKGTWNMRNGAVLYYNSSTGRPLWIGEGINEGTLRILDRSQIALHTFKNTGEIEMGAGATIGHVELSGGENILLNTGKGTIRVTGGNEEYPTAFGCIEMTSNGKRILKNGTEDGNSTARLLIGGDKGTAALRITGGQVDLMNYVGSTLEIHQGSLLALMTNDNGSNHRFYNRNAKIFNSGEMLLAGKLKLQSNHAGFTGIENTGQLTLRGDKIEVERLVSSSGPGTYGNTQIINQKNAFLAGTGTLTYINSAEPDRVPNLKMVNMGTLSPGGKQAESAKSAGKLTLKNVNLCLGGDTEEKAEIKFVKDTCASTLLINIGGLANAPDRYDSLQVMGDNGGGNFELQQGVGNILNIVPFKDFTPHGTYRIVTATKVKGTFEVLQYKGKLEQVPYKVNYLPDGIEVVFP